MDDASPVLARNFALVVCFTATSAYVGFEVTAPLEPPRVRFATEAPAYLLGDPPSVEDNATKSEEGGTRVDNPPPVQVAVR